MRATTVTKKTTVQTECRPSRAATPGARAGRRGRTGCLVALAAALLASSALFAPTVLAHHFTGEVQLWVSKLDFRGSPDGVLVTALLLEREFGKSVSGFGVRVAATDQNGNLVGPIELQESEPAVYSGTLPLGPGQWRIVATAHQGNSSLPAIESTHRETLEIDETGQLLAASGGGSAATTVLAIVLPVCAVVVILAVVLRRSRHLGPDDGTDAEGGPDEGVPEAPAASGDPVRD